MAILLKNFIKLRKSVATAKREHSNVLKLEIIEKCNGTYRLKEKSSENNNPENDEDDNNIPF